MSGASDKARFYLEQAVPQLQEFKEKKIFNEVCIFDRYPTQSNLFHDERHWSVLLSGLKNRVMAIHQALCALLNTVFIHLIPLSLQVKSARLTQLTDTPHPKPMLLPTRP